MRGEATAKAILFGEHAVVHGVAAVAVPIAARRTEVEIEPRAGACVVEVEDAREVETALARTMARLALDLSGRLEGARLTIRSDVPLGSGLGSSAALAVALVRATGGAGLAVEEVARRALELEKLAHGTPSGIDSATIAWARPLAFRKGEPPEPLSIGAPLRLAIGILPREGTTASLVAGVAQLARAEPERFRAAIDAVRNAAALGRTYLERGDRPMVGMAMSANHGALRALGVSTPALDEACELACQAGALGAKMSGAGGGGAAIALLDERLNPAPVLAALRVAGARETFLADVRS